MPMELKLLKNIGQQSNIYAIIGEYRTYSKPILVVEKIRGYINCEDCRKRRCVYSDKSLNCDKQHDY